MIGLVRKPKGEDTDILASGAPSPEAAAGPAGTSTPATGRGEPADPVGDVAGASGAGAVVTMDRSNEMAAPGEAWAGTSAAVAPDADGTTALSTPVPALAPVIAAPMSSTEVMVAAAGRLRRRTVKSRLLGWRRLCRGVEAEAREARAGTGLRRRPRAAEEDNGESFQRLRS